MERLNSDGGGGGGGGGRAGLISCPERLAASYFVRAGAVIAPINEITIISLCLSPAGQAVALFLPRKKIFQYINIYIYRKCKVARLKNNTLKVIESFFIIFRYDRLREIARLWKMSTEPGAMEPFI